MNPIFNQIVSGLCWVVYGSFFEWYFHKFWMHYPRVPEEAFRGHTIVHHGLYKGDDSYFVPEGEHPEHILLKRYALPAIVLVHLPILMLVEKYVAAHTAIGGTIAMTLYFVIYEYMHWNMHVPRGHFVERFQWFQFLRDHHHLHHRYFQKNFCVLFPLADLVCGTLETKGSLQRRKLEREQAIAKGEPHTPTRNNSRGSKIRKRTQVVAVESASPISRSFEKFESRRKKKQAQNQDKWKHEREQFVLTNKRNIGK